MTAVEPNAKKQEDGKRVIKNRFEILHCTCKIFLIVNTNVENPPMLHYYTLLKWKTLPSDKAASWVADHAIAEKWIQKHAQVLAIMDRRATLLKNERSKVVSNRRLRFAHELL